MTLAHELFEHHAKLAVGTVNEEMIGKFVEKLDTYFVRDVAFSINQDSKPAQTIITRDFVMNQCMRVMEPVFGSESLSIALKPTSVIRTEATTAILSDNCWTSNQNSENDRNTTSQIGRTKCHMK